MPKKAKTPEIEEKAFAYAVGRPWEPEDPNSTICFYTYHNEIQHGTLSDAIVFRNYCNIQAERDHKNEGKKGPPPKYRIYQVVEIPNSEYLK